LAQVRAALQKERTVKTFAKKLNQRVHASLGTELPQDLEPGGATKAYWAGARRGHLINHFTEIGWVEPAAEAKPGGDDDKSLLGAQFQVLVYDGSKYVHGWPPTMVYLPSAALMRAMVKACLKEQRGADGRLLTATASSEILQQFTDLAWLRQRAQEKAEAAAAAQAATQASVEAQPGSSTPDGAAADALSLAAQQYHPQQPAAKEPTDRRKSTKHKRKQSIKLNKA
jgi:hypothetical protein